MVCAPSVAACLQESLPSSAKGAKGVAIQRGSGAVVRPMWVRHRGRVREGCRVELQLNVNFHMRVIPPPMMGFLLKV